MWEDWDLVFSPPTDARSTHAMTWDDWKDLLQVAGVRDARVHDGRHTAGTLLGHSDSRVTERYTHVASPLAQDASARLGRVLVQRTETETKTNDNGPR